MLSDSEDENEHTDGKSTKISWRMDPEDSLSDWTIKINSPCGLSATYDVHKIFLSVECQYFARLFCKKNNDEQQYSEFADCTSRFNFDQKKAFHSFPAFLDCIYESDDQIQSSSSSISKIITIENAIALYYLAEYFGYRYLRRSVRRFFERTLSPNTLSQFYQDIMQFQNEKFLSELIQYCASHVWRVKPSNRIVTVTDHVFWLTVLSRFKPSSHEAEALSLLIAEFCTNNYQDLDLDLLAQLTDESKLPKIHHQAAIQLMAVEHKMQSSSTSTESTTTNNTISCENGLVGRCYKLDLDKVAVEINLDSNVVHLLKAFQADIKRSKEDRFCSACNCRSCTFRSLGLNI